MRDTGAKGGFLVAAELELFRWAIVKAGPAQEKSPESLRLRAFYIWCRLQDLNPLPHDYKSSALPDELSRP